MNDRASRVASQINKRNSELPQTPSLLSEVEKWREQLKETTQKLDKAVAQHEKDPQASINLSKKLASEIKGLIQSRCDIKDAHEYVVLRETAQHLRAVIAKIENHSQIAQEGLHSLNRALRKIEEKVEAFPSRSQAAFYAANQIRLQEYFEQLAEGRIVQVPLVREVIEKAKNGLSSKNSTTLYGHTGLGKTEISRVVAKEVTGKEPLLVRCYFGMPTSDLFGSHALVDSKNLDDLNAILARLSQEATKWKKSNPDASQEERARALDVIYNPASSTISTFIKGVVYQAAQEGRVVILDEFNTLPDNIRLALNDILTKKPGEQIVIPETGEALTIAPGFGFIQTANINTDESARYSGRQTIESSQHERSHFVHLYDLPQTLLRDVASNPGIEESQLYAIAVAACLNRDLTLTACPQNLDSDPLNSIWRLCQLAKITQLAFSNRIAEGSEYSYLEGNVPVKSDLTVQISNRRLITLLETWKRTGTYESLDKLILDEVINQSTKIKERRYLYQLAQQNGFFSAEHGWPSCSSVRSMEDFDRLKPDLSGDKPTSVSLTTASKEEVMRAVFGAPPAEQTIEQNAVYQKAEQALARFTEKIGKYEEELGLVCPVQR